MDTALIIFAKNPVYGKVKTRLAATAGHAKALEVYQCLLSYTRRLCMPLPHSKYVYYTDHPDPADQWSNDTFMKRLQHGPDLGARMMQAFRDVFVEGHARVCIIGSDCLELTATIIGQAFEALEHHDVVIGPASDGGYYLLGMNRLHQPLFENMAWSTGEVLHQTLAICRSLQLDCCMLPQLNDIDDEAGWIKASQHNTKPLTL